MARGHPGGAGRPDRSAHVDRPDRRRPLCADGAPRPAGQALRARRSAGGRDRPPRGHAPRRAVRPVPAGRSSAVAAETSALFRYCGCGTPGCQELTRGEFAPGHDAKRKSMLWRLAREGRDATDELRRRGWKVPPEIATEGDRMRFETAAIHAGQDPDAPYGAVNVPIYQTSTYAQPSVGKPKVFDYARGGNPTREAFQTALAALEGGERASRSGAGWRRRRRSCSRCGPATTSCCRTTSTAARTGSCPRCSSPGGCRTRSSTSPTSRICATPSAKRPASSGSRRRRTRCSGSSTWEPSPRPRTRPAHGSSSTTRSPPPRCSGRSSSVPTPSCTASRSTSVVTPT